MTFLSFPRLFPTQPRLHLLPLLRLHRSNLLPGSIRPYMYLVKRILFALFKLLPAKLNTLLSPQTRILLLNLRQSAFLKRRIGSLEPSFRVPINLAAVLLRQRQRIQGIVDTRSAERRPLLARRTVVQLCKIQSPCFLLCGLGTAAFGFRGLRCFFGGELRVSLGLLARCFGFLGLGVVSVMEILVPSLTIHIQLSSCSLTSWRCSSIPSTIACPPLRCAWSPPQPFYRQPLRLSKALLAFLSFRDHARSSQGLWQSWRGRGCKHTRALPAAFLEFSPAAFLPPILWWYMCLTGCAVRVLGKEGGGRPEKK